VMFLDRCGLAQPMRIGEVGGGEAQENSEEKCIHFESKHGALRWLCPWYANDYLRSRQRKSDVHHRK